MISVLGWGSQEIQLTFFSTLSAFLSTTDGAFLLTPLPPPPPPKKKRKEKKTSERSCDFKGRVIKLSPRDVCKTASALT